MIRDGHFLPEPPVRIGAAYDRAKPREEFTPEEIDWQAILLGERPRRRRPLTGIEVTGVIAAAVGLFHALFWLAAR